MKHRFALPILLVVLAFGTGCAVTVPQVEDPLPLVVQYDIQYVDNTKIGIDLMLLSADETLTTASVEEDVYRSVQNVADALPQSAILQRQSEFRQAVADEFRRTSPYADKVQIVVVEVFSGTWVAQR